MDNNNWRPIQGGEPAMDAVDWRTQLQPDSRLRIVNKLTDTLKKYLPFSGQEGLHELKKIAGRFEEKIYTAATSQSDYLRKISLKMLAMETKSQNSIPNYLPTNPVGTNNRPLDPVIPLQRDMPQRLQLSGQTSGSLLQTYNVIDQQKQQLYQSQRAPPETSSTSLDSTAQTGHANASDEYDEVYQKIQAMKEQYLPELSEMYQKIAAKLQQQDSLPQHPKSEQYEKMKLFKSMLERAITFLEVPKGCILPGYKDKLAHYEKQIVNFINT